VRLGVALLLLLHGVAAADSLELPAQGARATARAGAGVLSTDDGNALHYNPAGLARRTALRVHAGLAAVRRKVRFASDAGFPSGAAPAVESRDGIALAPWGGAAIGIGDRVVVGGAFLTPTATRVGYPGPVGAFMPMADDRALYPQRYGGERLELERRGGGLGAAVRILPWLAVGAAGLVNRVSLEHDVTLWAGPPSVGPGLGDLSPAYDMRFTGRGSGWAAGFSGGLVVAPLELPLEAGLAVTWSAPARLSGTPSLAHSRGLDPAGSGMPAASAVLSNAGADLELRLPTTVRAGARLLLPRVVLEVDGELSFASGAPRWSLAGVSVRPASEDEVALAEVPLGVAFDDAFAVRGAIDVDVVPGTIALIGGYAFVRRNVTAGRETPLFPGADRHVVGLGIEARVAGATATLGALTAFRASGRGGSEPRVIDPRGPIVPRAASGDLEARTTLVALDVEVSFDDYFFASRSAFAGGASSTSTQAP
jgi:hypothetical protein